MDFIFVWQEQSLTREILFLTLENKVYISELLCSVLFIIHERQCLVWIYSKPLTRRIHTKLRSGTEWRIFRTSLARGILIVQVV